jgi:hypothetical protein
VKQQALTHNSAPDYSPQQQTNEQLMELFGVRVLYPELGQKVHAPKSRVTQEESQGNN